MKQLQQGKMLLCCRCLHALATLPWFLKFADQSFWHEECLALWIWEGGQVQVGFLGYASNLGQIGVIFPVTDLTTCAASTGFCIINSFLTVSSGLSLWSVASWLVILFEETTILEFILLLTLGSTIQQGIYTVSFLLHLMNHIYCR